MASYGELVNVNGTIYNTSTGQGYRTPEDLARDLGTSRYGIQWGNIRKGSAPTAPAARPASAEQLQDIFQKQTADLKAQREALLNKQKQEQEGLFGQYEKKREGQEPLERAYQKFRGEEGVEPLQEAVSTFTGATRGTKELLDRLEEDVNSRTEGTFVTEAQRRRMEATERKPLVGELERLGDALAPVTDALNLALGEVSKRTSLTKEDQDRAMEGLTLRINAVSDRFAREITGFETSSQQQLSVLLDKLERERSLADREWQLAQQLAAEEREFQRQKEMAAINAANKAREAAGNGLDLSGLLGSIGGGGGDRKTTDLGTATQMVNEMKSRGGNWGSIAFELENKYGKIGTGSVLDQALNKVFGGGGSTPYIRPSPYASAIGF